ncbi:FAD-dependent oxidoreductase [Streptomyces sp. UMAF16]|nr:FAD-dependent oxidoreductase [Streptomyces sp. UMAF16]
MHPPFDSFDVIVVGYGFAGAAAAITAHDQGSRVLVLEKMPHGGGNSRVSGGNCVIARSGDGDRRRLVDYLHTLCLGSTGRDVVEALVDGAMDLPEWFAALDAELSVPEQLIIADTYPRTLKGPGFPAVAGDGIYFDKYCVAGSPEVPPSRRMWEALEAAVEARDITVLFEARVQDLVRSPSGEVTGVELTLQGRPARIDAAQGVVMTCGGYENSPELISEYVLPPGVRFAGNPGNTGDGVRVVQRAGADLWHMSRTSTIIGFQSEEYVAAFGIFFPTHGFIYVDRHGERFADETGLELHEFHRLLSEFDTRTVDYPRLPSWGVFNERTRLAGPLSWSVSGYNRELYQWSADNSREIKMGWIVQADTVAELAERIEVPAEALAATLTRYNTACAEGADPEQGRSPETLEAIEGPYYAIRLEPTVLNTQGGARRDARARVLDTRGAVIPRLYSAGEFGSAWGGLYQGATNITECLSVGRIAGRELAALARVGTGTTEDAGAVWDGGVVESAEATAAAADRREQAGVTR